MKGCSIKQGSRAKKQQSSEIKTTLSKVLKTALVWAAGRWHLVTEEVIHREELMYDRITSFNAFSASHRSIRSKTINNHSQFEKHTPVIHPVILASL